MTNCQQPQEKYVHSYPQEKQNKTKQKKKTKKNRKSLIKTTNNMFPLGIMTVILTYFQTSKRFSFGKHLYCCYYKEGSYGPI